MGFTIGFVIGVVLAFVTYRVGWYGGAQFERTARLNRLKSIRKLISAQAARDADL